MVGHKTEEKLVRAVNLTGIALAGCCECDAVLFLFIGVHPQSQSSCTLRRCQALIGQPGTACPPETTTIFAPNSTPARAMHQVRTG